ncbi:MAG: asparagine synthase-related protein [Rhizomicrobium sp.]
MSAIFGVLRFDGAPVSPRALERMANTLAHCAPDGRASLSDGPAGLGHGLLRITREDRFETQPLRVADIALVADLRLDNREDLGAAFGLGAAALREMPDSALLLRAYRKWGEDCAAHLLGDFVFAIWDGRARKLVLGRDHMGQRQLHYHRGKDFLAFASEIKALWALDGVPRKLDETQLGKYLLFDSTPGDGETHYEAIRNVLAGETLSADVAGNVARRRYWEPQAAREHEGRDERYYVENYRAIFAEAVACRVRRLLAPPALCLSGGFDSAAIAGLAGPALTTGGKLVAVSSVLPAGYDGPLPSARRWVELCRRDMPHLDIRYVARGEATVLSNLEQTFLAGDSLPNNMHYVVDALFREARAAGARLVMDGTGGDEGLNPRGGGFLAHLLRTGQLRRLAAELRPYARAAGVPLATVLRDAVAAPFVPSWVRRVRRRGSATSWATIPLAAAFVTRLLKDGGVAEANLYGAAAPRAATPTVPPEYLRRTALAPRRLHVTAAAARGLVLTKPLLDKRVVEFALAVPRELHVRDGQLRYLACRALADVLPREFQRRAPRQDSFEPDFAGMMQDGRAGIEAGIAGMAQNPTLRGYFDFDKMHAALSKGGEAQKLALRSFCVARYVAWFNGENA